MKLPVIILLVIMAIFVIGGGVFFVVVKSADSESVTLEKISYSSSGGMDGGVLRKELKFTDGKAILTVEEKEYYNQPLTVSVYDAEGVFEKLNPLFTKSETLIWEKIPNLPIHVLDAPSSSYSLKFSDGTYRDISGKAMLPKSANKKLSEAFKIIDSCATEERLISKEEIPVENEE